MITLFVYIHARVTGSLWEHHIADWMTLIVYDVILTSIVMVAISLTYIAFGWKI